MAHALDYEIRAFEAMKEQLIANHNGKFVVIHRGQLWGAYDTLDAAAKAVIGTLEQPYLIRQVGAIQAMPMPSSVAYRPIHAAA